MSHAVIEDLTINEFYRLLKIVQGKINLEPLYMGLSQYFQNIIDCHSAYLPSSVNQIPFYQEVCIFTWRLMTNNQVSDRSPLDYQSRAEFVMTRLLICLFLL